MIWDVHTRLEGYTMALYTAVCLLATLAARGDAPIDRAGLLQLTWGVTLGLALAHLFAFRISSRLVGSGRLNRRDAESALAQLLGAIATATIASVGALLFPARADAAVQLALVALLALVGFGVARGGGASRLRAITYASLVVVIAGLVVVLKNNLMGH